MKKFKDLSALDCSRPIFIFIIIGFFNLIAFGGVLVGEVAQATVVPDFYKCEGKVSGQWVYGRAPYACNADSFGEDQTVFTHFGKLLFNDQKTTTDERNRYMQELYSVIRDAARYYLKKRKPQVDGEEMKWWILGIMATASNESYWSHYRIADDGRLKMMRGDYGHGHGLMQVDDRAHFNAVTTGLAWNIIGNITYSMDEFYLNWEKAPSQKCVNGAKDYESRVRSAWSAYNGGPSKLCRWTNPNDKWARNDKNFFNALRSLAWENYVADKNKVASVNVPCLVEQQENCPPPNSELPGETLDPRKLYRYEATPGGFCTFHLQQLSCVENFRDATCLLAVNPSVLFSNEESLEVLKPEVIKGVDLIGLDRHQICVQYEPHLFAVGTKVLLKKSINLRQTPGGGVLAVVPNQTVLEVLDFELRDSIKKDRYYQVQYKNKIGFIFGGDREDSSSWLERSIAIPSEKFFVTPALSYIEVSNTSGINLRKTPQGEWLVSIPYRTKLQVLDSLVLGGNNSLYYLVRYRGYQGYLYSGRFLPTITVEEWTRGL
ncbi:MAG: hypothetical protein K1X29_03405 [Bdellovibrionales bacterium]|nr:hypothetical protein [Bdellovibrionales bacterium]